MKKILFSFLCIMLCGFMAQGQNWGDVRGQVIDSNQNPVPGVAVFVYGTMSTFMNNGQDISKYERHTYTYNNGYYWSGYNNATVGDSVVVGVVDCNMNLTWDRAVVTQINDTLVVNIQISCVPGACDAVISENTYPAWPYTEYTAASLRDSNSVINALGGPVTHDWTYNGITRTSSVTFMGPNRDSIWIPNRINPTNVCYQRTAACTPICTNSPTPTPTHGCNAHFFVDSVNSVNFNGQVVVWENSTADSGATIVGYRWDFGDGSPTVNQQYPIHTYNDTNVYEVCLTIVSVKQTATGMDTCTSTYCDSIGFDSNGNLVYKSSGQGFTINVIDPATVGQEEISLESKFNLYPNPMRDEATLAWEGAVGVEQVDVISINGQLIRSITPNTSSIKLKGLETGVYILRVKSEQGETAVRLMVQ